MIQPIYLYGSEVLRKVAAPADLSDKEGLKVLVTDLWDTLAHSEGCGLAAPQIGVSLRVAVVDGNVIEMVVKPGDRVVTSKYSGTEVKLDGEEFIIVRQSDILAIVE